MGGSRRTVTVLCVAVACFVLVELGARALEPSLEPAARWPDDATSTKVAQMDDLGCADVVFIGNSTARDAFDPEVFELAAPRATTAYNASLDAASPTLLRAWLADGVLPRMDPTLVVWAVGSPDLNDASPAAAAALASYRSSVVGRRDLVGGGQRVLWDHLALVRHRGTLGDPARLLAGVRRALVDGGSPEHGEPGTVLSERGLGLSRRGLTYQPGDGPVRSFVGEQLLADFTVGPRQGQEAGALLDDLEERDIGAVLVVLPVTEEFRELHPGGPASWDRYRDRVLELGVRHDVSVVDLVGVVGDDGFADLHHVNARGATAVSQALAADLRSPLADLATTCGRAP